MSHTLNTAVSFGPTNDEIAGSVFDDGSNLPKYYFGDLPAEVMQEIMDEMAASQPGSTATMLPQRFPTGTTVSLPSRLHAEAHKSGFTPALFLCLESYKLRKKVWRGGRR